MEDPKTKRCTLLNYNPLLGCHAFGIFRTFFMTVSEEIKQLKVILTEIGAEVCVLTVSAPLFLRMVLLRVASAI